MGPAFWFSCVQPYNQKDYFQRKQDQMIFPLCCWQRLEIIFSIFQREVQKHLHDLHCIWWSYGQFEKPVTPWSQGSKESGWLLWHVWFNLRYLECNAWPSSTLPKGQFLQGPLNTYHDYYLSTTYVVYTTTVYECFRYPVKPKMVQDCNMLITKLRANLGFRFRL